QFSLSPGNYQTYRDENHSFTGITAWAGSSMNYAGAQEPEKLRAPRVTSNFFDVLHVQPILGRTFTKEENALGSEHVVIRGYGFWRRRFGGGREGVGESMRLNGKPYTIVGIMPKEFFFPSRTDLWRPLAMNQQNWTQRGGHYLGGMGRLKDGVSLQTAW